MAMESSSFWCRTLKAQMFIVHLVQDLIGNLAKLEQELQTMAEGEEVVKEEEVVAGSVWAVHQQEWYRVVAVRIDHGKAALQSLDYGYQAKF